MDLPMDQNTYLWNCWRDFLWSKFCGIVPICSCATSWSFAHLGNMGLPMDAHLTHIGLPMGWNAYFLNIRVDFLHLKFCELSRPLIIKCRTWPIYTIYRLAHGPSNGLIWNCNSCKIFEPNDGLSTVWSMGWRVLLFSEHLVTLSHCIAPDQWNKRRIWKHAHLVSPLTHWGRDKMAAISHTTFSSAFSWMKMCEFRVNFLWSLFLRV